MTSHPLFIDLLLVGVLKEDRAALAKSALPLHSVLVFPCSWSEVGDHFGGPKARMK
jgi:hypothetical protein